MAGTVKLKRSAVSGKIPTVSDLALGELAVNTFDGKAYIKKSANGVDSIVEIGAAAAEAAAAATPMLLKTVRVIDEDVVVVSGENALSINDVTIEDGVSVTIPENSTWVVIG